MSSEERERLAPEQTLDPPLGRRRPRGDDETGTESRDGDQRSWVHAGPLRVTLVTRITASPTQDATAAQAEECAGVGGRTPRSSPPRASSQDRTSSEKYALCAFDEVNTIEYEYEAMMTARRTTVSRSLNDPPPCPPPHEQKERRVDDVELLLDAQRPVVQKGRGWRLRKQVVGIGRLEVDVGEKESSPWPSNAVSWPTNVPSEWYVTMTVTMMTRVAAGMMRRARRP